MRCQKCNVPMIFTGSICLCGHKQFLCPKCRHIWSFNHKTPGEWVIDWDFERNFKDFLKKNKDKLGYATYSGYADDIIKKWKKNTKYHL